MNYYEQKIYDDGTYQVWQCQKRGYSPYFKLYKPWKLFGKTIPLRSVIVEDTLIGWWYEDELDALKDKIRKLKEFPDKAIEFTLED